MQNVNYKKELYSVDSVKQYFEDIIARPLLKPDEERDLIIRAQAGDEIAYKYFLECNLRLVVSIAKRYSSKTMDFLDLIQEGNIGLIIALKKFDVTKNFKFSTYAALWIKQSIIRAIEEKSRNIRIPGNIHAKLKSLAVAKQSLSITLGREPYPEDLANYMNLSVSEVKKLLYFEQDTVSLNAIIVESDSGEEFGNILPSYDMNFDNVVIDNLLERCNLSDKEMQILILHYGLNGGKSLTLDEIGQILGISRQRAFQLKRSALESLRKNAAFCDSEIIIPRKNTVPTDSLTPENTLYLKKFISQLSEQEAHVMRLRFGYEDGIKHKIADISNITGLDYIEVVTTISSLLKDYKEKYFKYKSI